MPKEVVRIGVIGGGLNGVAGALAILESFSNISVTVYSHQFSPDTTGDGAGGIWEPFANPGTSEENVIRWSQKTWDMFDTWFNEKKEGILLTPVTTVSREHLETPFWKHIPFHYKEMDQQQLKAFGPDYVNGFSHSSYVAEPRILLPSLMRSVSALGGRFEGMRVGNLEDLSDQSDILINCSGIGSRDLVPDPSVYPIRGQVMRVKAPWIDFSVNDESENSFSYIIPNTGSVVLGGTFQEDNWQTALNEDDTRDIWRNCTALVPQLKGSEVVQEWVGLRPARRKGIRLEEDQIRKDSKKIPVIHNYGHGGSGVTTFWGCSLEVKDILGKILHRYYGPHVASKL